ncbi:uncharacterized protein LOC129743873 [Uranotaenia lowii]|uniref:uncharacterized protein LOC129743873 n=1 Tax=Uranotaenia lowii TaxID=190385 RepID=UPI0024785F05|nr:uncharacterized protein LOC129743873 [Uranotaenia lowii]
MLVFILLLSLTVVEFGESAGPSNKFEVTRGCLQYNTKDGYNHAHPYFATSRFRHLNTTQQNVSIMRMGVLGFNDGHIRLAPVMYPYGGTSMNEIVLSGWGNTKIAVRRYVRNKPNNTTDQVLLKEQSSDGMLSYFEPFMFTLAIHPDGLVQLTRDEDAYPFLEFKDPKLSSKYIGFCNWDVPLVFFYDCPLEVDHRVCEGIVFSK